MAAYVPNVEPEGGSSDILTLPFTDSRSHMDDNARFGSVISDPSSYYNKQLFIGSDSLFYRLSGSSYDVYNVSHVVYDDETSRKLEDGVKGPLCIGSDVNYLLAFDKHDMVVVWSYGFNDIRFNVRTGPRLIAHAFIEALSYAAEKLIPQGIEAWFVTLPELGDLANSFREFNQCIRAAAQAGELKGVKVFDYAEALNERDSCHGSLEERLFMFLSFFDQKLDFDVLYDDERNVFAPTPLQHTVEVKAADPGDGASGDNVANRFSDIWNS